MVTEFTFDRISLGGPVFDLEKLSWLNGLYLRELTPAQLVQRLRAWRLSDEHLLKVATLIHERVRRLDEIIPSTEYFFSGDLDYAGVAKDLVPKGRTPKETAVLLGEFAEELDAQRVPFTAAALEAAGRGFAEKKEWKTKDLFMILRLVASGRAASPPLFETMEVLGKELVRRRMRVAADFIARLKPAS